MLPPNIASEICSLTPGEERLTVSVIFQVNAHTGVVSEDDTWIGKSIIKSGGKLTYKDVDAVLTGHVDTKLEGAEVKDIQILHVSFIFPSFITTLTNSFRRLHKNSANSVWEQTARQLLHSDSSINWMMRMCQLSTTFSTPPHLTS